MENYTKSVMEEIFGYEGYETPAIYRFKKQQIITNERNARIMDLIYEGLLPIDKEIPSYVLTKDNAIHCWPNMNISREVQKHLVCETRGI